VTSHPDKVPDEEREQATLRFQLITRAYETLTDTQKYDNWKYYGDPDGSSIMYKAIEIALPSFLLRTENHGAVLTVFFLGFICVPLGYVIRRAGRAERVFKNGILTENRHHMVRAIVNQLMGNHMSYRFSDTQVIGVYSEAREMQLINDQVSLTRILKGYSLPRRPQ
jgi:preprotein translocase subunit Sec63